MPRTNLYTNHGVIYKAKYKMAGQCIPLEGIHECHAVLRIYHKLCDINQTCPKKCKLNVPLAVGYLCNLEPHPQNCNLKHGYECEHKAPSMLLNPVHSAPSQACNVSQQRCRGGVPQNSGQLRRTARLISTEKRSPRMAENDKMLNSAKSAFCGSTKSQ